MSFDDSKFIESKTATISASSKTGIWEDSRTLSNECFTELRQHNPDR
jgi:hypothetical protein